MDANQWPLANNLEHEHHHVLKQEEEEGVERKTIRPQKDCPRCKSTNTKFCYYNNYSLSQPRYFCKTCRRYWTEGGTLRKVPVGGGSRKNKRSTPSSSSLLKKKLPENPNKIRGVHDLNLGYDDNQLTRERDVYNTSNCVTPILSFGELGKSVEFYPNPNNLLSSSSSSSCHLSFVGTTVNNSDAFNPLYPYEYFKLPSRFNFCLDGGQLDHDQIGYGNISSTIQHGTSSRALHPYEVERNSKPFTASVDHDRYKPEEEEEENKGQLGEFSGYLGGLLGGGSW